MESIKNDLGADLIRIGEFMWHEIEPADGVFNFTLLDAVLAEAERVGLQVMLGTPTATMPAWLHKAHPDVMARGPDSPEGYAGAVPGFGGRRQYSFNSATYLQYSRRVVSRLVERYGGRAVVRHWQIDNELGHEGSDLDFSDNALAAWRAWLRSQYAGDVGRLNRDWGTAFWSVTYNGFDEVPLPRWTRPGTPARPNENFRSTSAPGMLLDYRRFRSESVAAFARAQAEILRNGTAAGVTTNSPGGWWGKAVDYSEVFRGLDFPAFDNYPVWGGSLAPVTPSNVALQLDTIRGWDRRAERHFIVAEQLIGAQGHDVIGYTPRPQQAVAWSAQALLHGATGIVFFRYRAAVFGQEEFCYGVLDHTTPRGTGRKWREAKQVFGLATQHAGLWTAPLAARVAVVYEADNVWAWQAQPQSTAFDFTGEMHRLYHPFWRHGVAVDVINGAALDAAALSQYAVVVLPAPMLVSDALMDAACAFAEGGGSLWVGFRADLKDARSQIRRRPSRLAALAGVTVDEIESLNVGSEPDPVADAAGEQWRVSVWREALAPAPGGGAAALFNYTDGFFGAAGYAAATRRLLPGGGEVVYIAAGIDADALVSAAGDTLARQNVTRPGAVPLPPNVERLVRVDSAGAEWAVTINHAAAPAAVGGETLPPFGVSVARA